MEEPITAPWSLTISRADFQKLKAGFEPRDMDDKWRIYPMAEEQNDALSINIARSWTGRVFYVLHLKTGTEESDSLIDSVTWEDDCNGIQKSARQVEKEVILVTRSILGCSFNMLPDWSFAEVFLDADCYQLTDDTSKDETVGGTQSSLPIDAPETHHQLLMMHHVGVQQQRYSETETERGEGTKPEKEIDTRTLYL